MSDWLPGAKVVPAFKDGGSLIGGPKKVVWHTTENDSTKTSALNLANYLNSTGNQVHIVWNPFTGEIVQSIPANRAARGLMNPAGGVETNRAGSVVIQIEVVAQASKPWTDITSMKNLDKIMGWLDALGIPRVWPAGASSAERADGKYNRSTTAWAKSGHFAHQNVPENWHWDSGKLNQDKITGAAAKPLPVKVPAAVKETAAVKPKVSAADLADVKAIQLAIHVPNDGKFGAGSANAVKAVVNKDLSNVKYLQTRVGAKPDGVWGRNSEDARIATVKKIQRALGLTADGDWGPKSSTAYKAFYTRVYNKF